MPKLRRLKGKRYASGTLTRYASGTLTRARVRWRSSKIIAPKVKDMYANEHLKQYTTLKEIDLTQTTQTEAQLNQAQHEDSVVVDVVFAFGTIGLIAIVATACMMLSKISVFTAKPRAFNLKRSTQVPCRNCRYFSGNFYLKCAVHPAVVLTKEASNCADYSPVDKETGD